MLIRATVENYKSFNGLVELSMVSSSKIRLKRDHVAMLGGAKVLKHAAVYGANAAGKSNLIDFFRFFQATLERGLTARSANCYCRNAEENRVRPSTFELQFSVGDGVYAYGFSALLSKSHVIEEWLYEIGPKVPVVLLERRAAEPAAVACELPLTERERMRFETYADDFSATTNSLFLAELNRSKRFAEGSGLKVFSRVFEWLTHNIVTVAPMQPIRDPKYLLFEEGMSWAGDMLKSFDTGIVGLSRERSSDEELAGSVSEPFLERLKGEISARLDETGSDGLLGCVQTPGGLFFLEVGRDGSASVSVLKIRHRSGAALFDFNEESDGTRRLFDLLDLLLFTEDDVVYVVDELERSLHPMLVRHFLELFMKRNSEGRCQLIFSTHEASIMDQDLFRRDEIWFVDRSEEGDSRVYSLDRFKERFDRDIAKAYLDGRYGAVPAFAKTELGD